MALLAEETYLPGDFLELSSENFDLLKKIGFGLFVGFVNHAVGEALMVG